MDYENYFEQLGKLYLNNINEAPNMHLAFLKFLYCVPLDPQKKNFVINEKEMEEIRLRILNYQESRNAK